MHSDHLARLVLLYLLVAYETDHHFDPRERQAILQLAAKWAGASSTEHVEEIVDTAFAATRSGHADEVDALAHAVGSELTLGQRRHVLTDLGQIARADGYLSAGEANVISRIRAIWGQLR